MKIQSLYKTNPITHTQKKKKSIIIILYKINLYTGFLPDIYKKGIIIYIATKQVTVN